jgi:two-component system, NarL family, sensor histidine kinase UhpB
MEKLKEILIVEDNPSDSTLLTEYLDLAGVHADEINCTDRLKKVMDIAVRNVYPDLIFLDLNLPDSFGLETFLSVNGVFPYVPIVVLSGHSDTETAIQAIQAGAQDYIVKGEFDEKSLLKTVQYSIERKRNQMKVQETNRRYEIVSKATNDPVWDWDMINEKVVWNDKVDIFGYPEAVKKDYTWWAANIHPDDHDRISRKVEEYIKDSEQDHMTDKYRFRCADTTYKYILDRRYLIRDNNGQPTRMIGVLQDISEQVLLQQKLDEERLAQQKAILQATVEGQEKERSEIGKELHDNINQILASVKLMITASLAKMPEKDPFLTDGLMLMDECIQEIRRLSNALVPLREQEIELRGAIEAVIGRIKTTSELKFNFIFPDNFGTGLDDKQQLTIYRIIQEQINNILKHSNAKNVTISLSEVDKNAVLVITDDGLGFDKNARANGIGLKNMKSRAELLNGTFCIDSEPGSGCRLKVTIPLTR